LPEQAIRLFEFEAWYDPLRPKRTSFVGATPVTRCRW